MLRLIAYYWCIKIIINAANIIKQTGLLNIIFAARSYEKSVIYWK